jgi:hypothetical protein
MITTATERKCVLSWRHDMSREPRCWPWHRRHTDTMEGKTCHVGDRASRNANRAVIKYASLTGQSNKEERLNESIEAECTNPHKSMKPFPGNQLI